MRALVWRERASGPGRGMSRASTDGWTRDHVERASSLWCPMRTAPVVFGIFRSSRRAWKFRGMRVMRSTAGEAELGLRRAAAVPRGVASATPLFAAEALDAE